MENFLIGLDGFFLPLFKILGNPLMDFFLGTFILSILGVIIGEGTIFIVFRINRMHLKRIDEDMKENYDLSQRYLKQKDSDKYHQFNQKANDAFGKYFFNMVGLSAARLWPIFFILAWMQFRFVDIEFPMPIKLPLLGDSVGFVLVFFLCYLVSYNLWQWSKGYYPKFYLLMKR